MQQQSSLKKGSNIPQVHVLAKLLILQNISPDPVDLRRSLLLMLWSLMTCSSDEARLRLPWLPCSRCDTVLTSDSSRSRSRFSSGASWLVGVVAATDGCSVWSGTLSSGSGGFSASVRLDRELRRASRRMDGRRSLKLLCRSEMWGKIRWDSKPLSEN